MNMIPRGETLETMAEMEIKKLYWNIGEVGEMFGVAASAIRFWLSEFSIEIKKNKKGNRKFTAEDINGLRVIAFLVGGENNKRMHIEYVRFLIANGYAENIWKHLQMCEDLAGKKSAASLAKPD